MAGLVLFPRHHHTNTRWSSMVMQNRDSSLSEVRHHSSSVHYSTTPDHHEDTVREDTVCRREPGTCVWEAGADAEVP